jgi:hypothetical protein
MSMGDTFWLSELSVLPVAKLPSNKFFYIIGRNKKADPVGIGFKELSLRAAAQGHELRSASYYQTVI